MKVVVCGAGIAGLALAQRLGTAGHEVVVLERASARAACGAGFDPYVARVLSGKPASVVAMTEAG